LSAYDDEIMMTSSSSFRWHHVRRSSRCVLALLVFLRATASTVL